MESGLKSVGWRLTYYTSDMTESGKPVDILHDFYLPALNLATRYDRVAGYFRSSSLAAASQGYTSFLRHGGKMRLIVGADLQVQDVAAVLAERPAGGKVKVILETGALTDEEILGTVQALNQLDIDFYKTSTGFGYPGASVHAAELIMQAKRPEIQLKASGGIRTIEDAEQYLRLGATRIGASKLLAACMQRLRVPLG